MKKLKKIILVFLSVFSLLFIVLAMSPIPKATSANCIEVMGKVEKIDEAGTNDVTFQLENDDAIYYINRGLEKGLTLEDLQEELLNREISLHYVKHWSPLDPNNKTRHIAKLEIGEELIYNEMQK